MARLERQPRTPGLANKLHALFAAARAAWPGVPLSPEVFLPQGH